MSMGYLQSDLAGNPPNPSGQTQREERPGRHLWGVPRCDYDINDQLLNTTWTLCPGAVQIQSSRIECSLRSTDWPSACATLVDVRRLGYQLTFEPGSCREINGYMQDNHINKLCVDSGYIDG